MMTENGQNPQPMLPTSIRTAALVSGSLLHFDESTPTVVEKLEAARIGGKPAELHSDGRLSYVSPKAAEAWITVWEVNPTIVRAPAEADSLMRPRFG